MHIAGSFLKGKWRAISGIAVRKRNRRDFNRLKKSEGSRPRVCPKISGIPARPNRVPVPGQLIALTTARIAST